MMNTVVWAGFATIVRVARLIWPNAVPGRGPIASRGCPLVYGGWLPQHACGLDMLMRQCTEHALKGPCDLLCIAPVLHACACTARVRLCR